MVTRDMLREKLPCHHHWPAPHPGRAITWTVEDSNLQKFLRWQRSLICTSSILFHFVSLPLAALNRSVVSVISHSCVFFSSTVLEGCAVLLTHHYPATFWRGDFHAPGLGLPSQNLRLPCFSPACSTSPSAPSKLEVRLCYSLPQI